MLTSITKHTTAQRGAICPLALQSSEAEETFKAAGKVARAWAAGEEVELIDRNERSQTLRRARPWATLDRRATVHGVEASRSLSSTWSRKGSRYAARIYGRLVPAREERERDRKSWRRVVGEVDAGNGL